MFRVFYTNAFGVKNYWTCYNDGDYFWGPPHRCGPGIGNTGDPLQLNAFEALAVIIKATPDIVNNETLGLEKVEGE